MADQTLTMDSKQRVAFDLLKAIHQAEKSAQPSLKVDRKYILTLYRQCFKAVIGEELNDILSEE